MNVLLKHKRVKIIALLAIMVTAGIVGCAQIRKLTYPENFTYLEKSEVEALMQRMGESIGILHQLVAEATPTDANQQQTIIDELGKLESIATRLSGGHTQTNQFVIDDHIEQFISDIGTAKMYAKMNPPKYDRIAYVTNGCAECHQFR